MRTTANVLKRPWKLSFIPLTLIVTVINAFSTLDGPEARPNTKFGQQQQRWNTPSSRNSETSFPIIDNATKPLRRRRQLRRKSVDRRPRFYWLDQTNLCNELYQFWSNLGVSTDPSYPAIPNERLLMYFDRHDLRAAIVKNGGRASVSQLLNGAPIMAGRWKIAVRSSPELQQILQNKNTGLSPERSPRSDTTVTSMESSIVPKLWSHQSGRNRKGHWSLQMVIQELYVFFSYQIRGHFTS
jgi:hypothetical protein